MPSPRPSTGGPWVLAGSSNIAGFAKDFGEMPGWGWYQRDTNPRGALLPQQITEFTNAGLMVGLATVNLASDPMKSFNGFWGACSTYGSFSYPKYGPLRPRSGPRPPPPPPSRPPPPPRAGGPRPSTRRAAPT